MELNPNKNVVSPKEQSTNMNSRHRSKKIEQVNDLIQACLNHNKKVKMLYKEYRMVIKLVFSFIVYNCQRLE